MAQSPQNTYLYQEKLSSKKTERLFIVLMLVFAGLAVQSVLARGWQTTAGVLGFLALFFLFYILNFHTLQIQITAQTLHLKFGMISWTVQRQNIATCCLDDLPKIMALGGAGGHFMFIRGRYRASFNFLEYPRVVIGFRQKVGPVVDLSFSTQRPEEILQLLGQD